MSDAMRRALKERRDLIEARADAGLETALQAGEAWTKALGEAPQSGSGDAAWRQLARIVVAYRDRYEIVGADALGPAPQSTAQKLDGARARTALAAAHRLSKECRDFGASYQLPRQGLPPSGIRF